MVQCSPGCACCCCCHCCCCCCCCREAPAECVREHRLLCTQQLSLQEVAGTTGEATAQHSAQHTTLQYSRQQPDWLSGPAMLHSTVRSASPALLHGLLFMQPQACFVTAGPPVDCLASVQQA
jgi:hypothetical protein